MSRRLPFVLLANAVIALAAPSAAYAQAVTVFEDDFEATSGLDTTNWPSVNGNFDGFFPFGSGSRSGTFNGAPLFGGSFPSWTLYFAGIGTRDATTSTLDLSAYSAATITFEFRADSGSRTALPPFNNIDDDGEEVFLQYSTNANSTTPTWSSDIWRSDNATDYDWTTITVTLPTAALGSTVAFRWQQLNSELISDNWALDNVTVVGSPEPGTWALFGAGAAGLAVVAARRRRRRLRDRRAVTESAAPSP